MEKNSSDKIPATEIKSGFLRWLDNFWYHYKVQTIIVAFVLMLTVVSAIQMCRVGDRQDITVMYSGPYLMTKAELEGVRSALNVAVAKDLNGDGQKYVEVITYNVMSAEQLKARGEKGGLDLSYYSKEYENCSNMMLTGEFSVCFVDKWLFDELAAAKRLKPFSEIFDVIPENTVDNFGIRLSDTGLYAAYDALHILPDDTILCLLIPTVYGHSREKEAFEQSVNTLKNIVEFKY